jgi:membrane glycosyltransferase
VLAIFISWATSQRWLGLMFRRAGVLTTPETATPPIAKRGKALSKALARAGEMTSIVCWHTPIELRALHSWLPATPGSGQITADRASSRN